ncbi:MAG: ATP-dependent DNA helicase RecG [Porticoccaceae bacterium]|nr:MAG: ATP-dependent DNA helicase RecG [Porticoccaceae bacterium]
MAERRLERLPLAALHGVGPSVAARLKRLGLNTVQDLLLHLPLRYQDRTRLTPLGAARPFAEALVEGEIRLVDLARGRRPALLCRLQDGTGSLTLRFFHFSAAQRAAFRPGRRLRCYGEVRPGPAGPEMVHPEYRLFDGPPPPLDDHLTPVYPTCEGLGQGVLRRAVAQALALLERGQLEDLLPPELLAAAGGMALDEALRLLHRPPRDADLAALREGTHPARRRLAFEELLAHQLALLRLRHAAFRQSAPPLPRPRALLEAFLAVLPFTPTAAQRRVAEEIWRDLAGSRPMLRLVQGDVGSGKTLVAALAALAAVEGGRQVAVMAPTEILAEQHRRNFTAWFEPLGIRVAFLSGRQKAGERRFQLGLVERGEAQLVVGTHALFQEAVAFRDLGLAVIDEQHRFGVHQRLLLRDKGGGQVPHQLIMTATPIPRTLAMAAYADLDCSVIDELPPGRRPVTTVAVSQARRAEVVSRISRACAAGRQAYWVCTLIEESAALEAQAAEATAAELALALPHLRVGLVHGRLKPREKEEVMARFQAGEIQLLVATTVIEVGVDVPNASLMVIENPERLGLSQLHQLRGRVGRGGEESHCVLLYGAQLSAQGRERLRILRETHDGFAVAEHDLRLRGPGEFLGTRQTGTLEFRVADLLRDEPLLPAARAAAARLLAADPEGAARLVDRWVADRERYAGV